MIWKREEGREPKPGFNWTKDHNAIMNWILTIPIFPLFPNEYHGWGYWALHFRLRLYNNNFLHRKPTFKRISALEVKLRNSFQRVASYALPIYIPDDEEKPLIIGNWTTDKF